MSPRELPRLKVVKKKKKHIFLKIILSLIIITFFSALLFFDYIATNAPEFNPDNLYTKESTVLLYNDNTEFARLGEQNRELVKYEELPQVLIDAIISAEDSRFFEHKGFDFQGEGLWNK